MKMLKVMLVCLVVLVCGCSPSTEEIKTEFVLPKELKDCSMYRMSNGIKNIYVVRCPNSTTSTTTSGKHPQTTIVIDGVEYVKKEN